MKKLALALMACGMALAATAQDAFDVLHLSTTQLRGTSRYMSMAGSFGALGGDISVLNQNPGGIGVYRSSDLSITLSLDLNSAESVGSEKISHTKFNVNNIGYVGAMKVNSDVLKNFNWGFSYNRNNSFHRHYRGGIGNIETSLSNYIAAQLNAEGYTPADLESRTDFNPYFDGYAPWIGIVSYGLKPTKGTTKPNIVNQNGSQMQGLYGDGTYGIAEYEIDERGYTDEFSIAFGGNFVNTVYWGATVGIIDMDYKSYAYYGESLEKAYVLDGTKFDNSMWAAYGYENVNRTRGNGYNFKLGVIVKPVNEFRFGLAFHTPTFFKLHDDYYVVGAMEAGKGDVTTMAGTKGSNDGYSHRVYYKIKTPWRFIGSVAGVIGKQAMVNLDYEYVGNQTMRVGEENGPDYSDVTARVKEYFQPSHIVRLGAEFRINPSWSLRAGYSYKTTQVKDDMDKAHMDVVTVSNNPAYQYDNSEQHITAGLGYRYKAFYADLAYVHQYRKSVYNAFSPIVSAGEPNLAADIKDHNNRISLTLGYRF